MSDKNFKVKNGLDAVGPITISPLSNATNGLIFNTLAGGRAITFNREGSSVGSIDDWGTYNGNGINIVQPWYVRSPGVEAQSFFWVGSGARSAAGFAGTNSGTNPVIYISQNGSAANDLTQWIKSDNTVLAKVDYLGNITANDLTLAGNLTVNGTTTNLNSTNLIIEDKNIIIADVATPTNTTADGAGITIKGATDKTFNWVQSTGRFTSSEPIQSSAFVSTYVYASQIGSTVIGTATLNTNSDTGGVLINTAGVANKGLIVRGAASQTANLTEWQDSAGTILTKIDSGGRLIIGTASSTGADNFVEVRATGGYPTIKTGQTSQNRDIGMVWDVAGQQGQIATNSHAYPMQIGNSFIYINNSANNGKVGINNTGLLAQLGVTNASATNAGLIVKGAASQTANLQEWQNSSGTVLSSIGPNGTVYMGSTSGANIATFYNGTNGYGAGSINSSGTFNINGANMGFPYTSTGATLNVNAGASSFIPLTVRGVASQTADLQQWQNSDGTVLAKIDSSGNWQNSIQTNTTLYTQSINSGSLSFAGVSYNGISNPTGVTTLPTLVVKAIGSQSADLQQWQNSAGTVLAKVTAAGDINIDISQGGSFHAQASGGQVGDYNLIKMSQTSTQKTTLLTTVVSGGNTEFSVKTLIGSLTTTLKIDKDSLVGIGKNNTSPLAQIDVRPQSASTIGAIIRGAASQTADLTQWQNSSGTVLAKVDANGSGTFTGSASTNAISAYSGAAGNYVFQGFNQSNSLTSIIYQSGEIYLASNIYVQGAANYSAALNVKPGSTSNKGLVIRGLASQTGNLQEWQNSAGGVLAYVSNDGTFQNTGDINSGSTIRLGSGASSAGGYPVFAIKNATVAPTSNPTDGGVIYVESGSLKYRGQGGAITTIAASTLDDQEDIENSEVQLIQYGAEGSVLQNLPTRIHPAEQLLKESVLWLDPAHSSAGSQTIQNLGWGGTALNATAGANTSVSTDEPKYLSWEGENYIYATGETGNFMMSSASTSLGMTTSSDLDMRVKVSLDVLSGRDQMLMSTWWYRLHLTSAGYVGLSWNDNTAFNNIYSSNLLSSAATVGQEIWIRGTLKLNNGSGVSEIKFYTSKNGTTWTQLGTTYNGASTSILGAGGRSLSLEVGSLDGGAAAVASGKIYRAQVLQGVDGVVVFDCDTSLVSSGSATTFNALTGHIMTITRNTVGRKMVAVTHPLWLFGTDDYLKIADNNLLDFTTNQPFTIFLSVREFASTAGTKILLGKGIYGGWQGYTITSGDSFTQLYFSGPQANNSYYYSGGLGKSTTSRNYFYGRSVTNTFSYLNNNLIGGAEEVSPQFDTSNAYDLYLGRAENGQYSNMELFGVAIWRRALTAAEIATVSRYYEGRAI